MMQLKCALKFLCLALVLFPQATHTAGECFFNGKATCEHKGVRLETGDIWINEDCYQCICLNPFGVGCCDKVSQPVDYPDWCEVIQRPNSCLLAVVMKANHKIACISKTTMGRLRPRYGYKEGENPFFEQWRA
ncbi:prostate-associated microseminoprotein-like isoform X2 [Stegostoma tigrinum]|uniref:prostate-associated microseminoprotein-like isoform X2 n=1 Tax=Stegostoma tigrinum TaxID=3053191 RepID=UPI00202AF69E|nr:prostate-associated microseminoprotein-like isoform X2 [Stegostoma tigrinum]